ncbi:MAG: complex I subunit 4 family protein, partial [Tumebacillaceae bacterium]
MGNLLTLIILLPLLGALILGFVPRGNNSAARGVAVFATLLPLIFAGIVYSCFQLGHTGMQCAVDYKWIHIANVFKDKALDIGFSLGVDGL